MNSIIVIKKNGKIIKIFQHKIKKDSPSPKQTIEWKKLVFVFCFFHTLFYQKKYIISRRYYGNIWKQTN